MAPDRDEVHPELEAEQRHLDAAYERLEAMRRSAAAVAEAYADVQAGGTHQARLERDAAEANTRRRLAALDIGEAPLCFGRIDLRPGDGAAAGEAMPTFYVGRVAVDDEDHQPIVVDWRAPVAEPFYRATAVEPMGVVRRRHLVTKGRTLVGIDDEVFDRDAPGAASLTVMGEGALLAALERHRTGRMGDIVATIQAEQDAAIRADLAGVLVVAGGPGTGKTAVALHRAAYLLYTHRRRLESRGVLLVGPGPVFLRYIERVLPSLGEDQVVLSTIAGLKPGLRVTGVEPAATAALKGDARMAGVIARAVVDRERTLPRDIVVPFEGHRLRITRAESARIVGRARRRRGSHNARRPYVVRLLLDHLVERYRHVARRAAERSRFDPSQADHAEFASIDGERVDPTLAAALARGDEPPEGWHREVAGVLRRRPAVREALERMWPVLSGAELVHDLFSFPALVHSAAAGALTADEEARLVRPRSPSVADVAWTEADVALVDEADAALGPVEAARPARRARRRADEGADVAARVLDELGLSGRVSASDVAARYGEADRDGAEAPEPRTFGHVLVDEAQDLTPMQWRMLGRRCPSGSMTVVGDFGQASRPGSPGSWPEVVRHLPSRAAPRFVTLTVNYRTPAEVMEVANRLLCVAAPGVEPTRAARATGTRPSFVAVDADRLLDTAATAARESSTLGGTVAVIAPDDLHADLVALLADVGAVADRVEALDAPVAVLGPGAAKGLEFDHVVVVEPSRLVTPDPLGLRLLYVVLTRTTRRLVVVHAGPLPEALVTPS